MFFRFLFTKTFFLSKFFSVTFMYENIFVTSFGVYLHEFFIFTISTPKGTKQKNNEETNFLNDLSLAGASKNLFLNFLGPLWNIAIRCRMIFYLHKMKTGRLVFLKLWQLNPLVGPDGGSSKGQNNLIRKIVQLSRSALNDSYLRPHIRLYHTIVPWRWCCDDETDCCWGSGVLIWIEVCMLSFCWFKPIEDPPIAGLMPLLMHGTPMSGVGSSGGVT